MNCKLLCVASMAVALVFGNVARADLTDDQLEALAQEYVSLLYSLDSLEQSLDDTNARITRWEYSINAMESSLFGLTMQLLAHPSPTDAEVISINAQLEVLYIQIPHAQSELESYESQRDSLQGQITGTQIAMALIAQILAGY